MKTNRQIDALTAQAANRRALIAFRAAGGQTETHRRRLDSGRFSTVIVADLGDGLGRRIVLGVITSTEPTHGPTSDAARACVRGDYQADIMSGRARWSGSDLRGKAAEFGGKYRASREALLNRLRKAGCKAEVRDFLNANRRVMRVLFVDGVATSATA